MRTREEATEVVDGVNDAASCGRGGGSVQRFDGRRHCYVLGVGGIRGGVSGPVRPVRTVWPVNHGCPAV